jgi:hypothetical protein
VTFSGLVGEMVIQIVRVSGSTSTSSRRRKENNSPNNTHFVLNHETAVTLAV